MICTRIEAISTSYKGALVFTVPAEDNIASQDWGLITIGYKQMLLKITAVLSVRGTCSDLIVSSQGFNNLTPELFLGKELKILKKQFRHTNEPIVWSGDLSDALWAGLMLRAE